MYTADFNYSDENTQCIGYVAYDDSIQTKRPAVIVVHAFEGRNELACEYARKLAELGYVGFAVDMYGGGKVATDLEGCMNYLKPFFADRIMLRQRILAGFNAVKTIDIVDTNKIAAMGFCFGGMTVLDLARSGADVKGVISFHGVFAAPENLSNENITAKVMVLHGYNDPQVPPTEIAGFAKEMDAAGVDWQVTFYGNTQHAFTDPDAAKIGPPDMGRVYNPKTTARAWQQSCDFFEELFS